MIDSINDNDNIKDINIKDVLVIEPKTKTKTKTRKRPILNLDTIRNAFKEFFIDDQDKTFNFEIVETKKGNYILNILSSIDENETKCGKIIIYKKEKIIHLDLLYKCDITGTQFLDKLEQFAQKYKFEGIQLEDGSEIIFNQDKDEEVHINLWLLKILSKGESWYNSKGYTSDDYENEKLENEKFITKPISILVDLIIQNINKYKKKRAGREGIDLKELDIQVRDLLNKFTSTGFSGFSSFNYYQLNIRTYNITIQEYFTIISNNLNDLSKNHNSLELIHDMLDFIEPEIKYDYNLEKQIIYLGGKGNKRKTQKRKKNKDKTK